MWRFIRPASSPRCLLSTLPRFMSWLLVFFNSAGETRAQSQPHFFVSRKAIVVNLCILLLRNSGSSPPANQRPRSDPPCLHVPDFVEADAGPVMIYFSSRGFYIFKSPASCLLWVAGSQGKLELLHHINKQTITAPIRIFLTVYGITSHLLQRVSSSFYKADGLWCK